MCLLIISPKQLTLSQLADLAEQFLSSVFRLHGLPDKIVSDRGPTFVSKFWVAVQKRLCVSPFPSTAFHPETDGQTERVNAVLEDYLWYFVNERQDDWVAWLPLAEFSYNNTPSSSTLSSPFFSCFGFHPRFNSLSLRLVYLLLMFGWLPCSGYRIGWWLV